MMTTSSCVVPTPLSCRTGVNVCVAGTHLQVQVGKQTELLHLAEFIQSQIDALHNNKLNPGARHTHLAVKLSCEHKRADVGWGVPEESYTLVILEECIEITSATKRGLFYGSQTLLQLLPDRTRDSLWLPCIQVSAMSKKATCMLGKC